MANHQQLASADRAYLRGLDLFDHRYYWECHEQLEHVWKPIERDTPWSDLVQGLIQGAAYVLKIHMKAPSSAAQLLLDAATRRLDHAASDLGDPYRGVHLIHVIDQLHGFARSGNWPTVTP